MILLHNNHILIRCLHTIIVMPIVKLRKHFDKVRKLLLIFLQVSDMT
jgi:hypothetical protein